MSNAWMPSTRTPPEALSWRKVLPALLTVCFAVYFLSLGVPFHFDDLHSIQNNPAVHSLSQLGRIWTDPAASSFLPENRIYRPLTFTVYALCWAIGGGLTWPFHLVKILMHGVLSLSLFLIWRRLFSVPGWFPARFEIADPIGKRRIEIGPELAALLLSLIYAVHPALSESVIYICSNTSLQCAMFYALAYVTHLHWRDLRANGERRARRFFAITLALYVAATLSKEEGITFPAVIVLTGLFLNQGDGRTRLKHALQDSWPFWLTGAALMALVQGMLPAINAKSRGAVPPLDYFMTQWRAYLWYMKIWFWPWGLNADNVEFGFSRSLRDPAVIQALIANIALIAFAWRARRRFPAFLFGLLWFYIAISPASSIVPLAEPVNERRMLLAYLGFVGGSFTLLSWLLFEALKAKADPRMTTAVLALIFAGLLTGTQTRIQVWSSPFTLWQDTVEKNPSSGRAMNNLALIYFDRGEYPQAIRLLNRCEQAWSRYVYCPMSKGVIYLKLRNTKLAEQNLLQAMSFDPDNNYVNFYLGRLYDELKNDPTRALLFFSKADQLAGGNSLDAKTRMVPILVKLGAPEKARGMAAEILKLDPRNAVAQEALRRISSLAPATGAPHP